MDFDVTVQDDSAKAFVLDTRDLTITSATVDGQAAAFALDAPTGCFGSKLSIPLPSSLQKKSSNGKVRVQYVTSPDSSACAWLPPPQTAGKKRPFLFTQCQAIHARSLLPCQDCPGTKCTWSAEVSAPSWSTVLMSALQKKGGTPGTDGSLLWQYDQPVPTCTYLIALAVGDLKGQDISPRCKIWAEPSMVEAAAWEFADTEKFLKIAESLTCPYQWTRYDVLCLPPSFPYGGMENPCLTFVTPTLLAGDRSLADVIAHEIAHSWTGNLVTNATWEHFWLNEGWTMWLQRRIMMQMEADRKGLPKPIKADFDFSAMGGWSSLGASVQRLMEGGEGALTKLVPNLDGIDPDEAFSVVPYEKGCNLLYALQNLVGEDTFLAFAKAYIQEFKSKLVTSDSFKAFAIQQFGSKISGFDWDGWMYKEGMPPTTPAFDKSIISAIQEEVAGWLDESKPVSQDKARGPQRTEAAARGVWGAWSSAQQQHFLDLLLEATTNHSGDNPKATLMPLSKLKAMDWLYGLTESRNCEIRFRWCTLCLRHGEAAIVPAVQDMLSTQGRMKYTRPLYRDLMKFQSGKGKALAVKAFLQNRKFYHPICRKMVSLDLGVANEEAGGLVTWTNGLAATAVVSGLYFAWAYWQVRNNRCPIPFHNLMVAKKK